VECVFAGVRGGSAGSGRERRLYLLCNQGHDDGDDRKRSCYVWLGGGGAGVPRATMRGEEVVRAGWKESWTKAVSQSESQQEMGSGSWGTDDKGVGGRGSRLTAATRKRVTGQRSDKHSGRA